jgi:nucleolar complex protein 2
VVSWQYLNCLKFWTKVVGTICGANAQDGSKPSQLAEAIYPLVEISIGLIKLMPSVQFLPLRFHLIRMLVELGKQTGTYVPLAPYLFELFNIDEVRKKAKSVSMPPLDFDLVIKAPKEYLHGKVYQVNRDHTAIMSF